MLFVVLMSRSFISQRMLRPLVPVVSIIDLVISDKIVAQQF